MEMSAKCCPVAQNAYKTTLHKYHPWVVQKAATMGMHMLPTKEGLIQKICGEDKEALREAERVLPLAVQAMTKVYDLAQSSYEQHQLLDLP